MPECAVCRAPVSDLVEPEVKEKDVIKPGKYLNSYWICNDCISSRPEESGKVTGFENCRGMGYASPADVSPNTPKADEADA